MALVISDNGGRRSGIERRLFSYSIHIPELRSGKDRRSGIDRRSERVLKLPIEIERRAAFKS